MTDSQETSSDRERTGQELRQLAARIGLSSARKIADQINEDRGMVGRVLKGDPTVSPRMWESIETQIRALDHEMSSDYDELPAATAINPHRVVVRASGNFGVTFMVEGDVSDLDALEDAIVRLVKRMESDPST